MMLKYTWRSPDILAFVRKSSAIASKRKLRNHVYCQTNQWENLQEFSQALLKHVIFNEDGLVMINKPYGVGVNLPPKTPRTNFTTIIHTLNTAPVGNANICLSEVLPYFAEALGYDCLSLIKVPEKYTSGVALLSASDEVTSRVQQCMRQAKAQKHIVETFSAVVVGCPQPLAASLKLGLKLDIDPVGQGKQPILVNEWSKGAVQRQEVLPTIVEHTTISQGPLASLVELQSSRTKWHFVRVYLAHSLSPVLGDNLYGSRVQNVLGVPITISPFSDRAKSPQKMSKQLLATLALKPSEEGIIPAHIHLRRFSLPNYRGNGTSLTVEAPFLEAFQWTCTQLHLQETSTVQIKKAMS